MFGGILQPAHLILILIIVLIVFGPGKLPEIGGAIGKSMKEFRKSTSDAFGGSDESTATAVADPTASAAPKVCSTCQTENAATMKFCGKCGTKLA